MLGYLLRNNPQEIYAVDTVKDGFVLYLKSSLYAQVIEHAEKMKFREPLSDLETTSTEGVTTIHIPLPFIKLPNYFHKKIDWDTLHRCAEKIQVLFWLLNAYFEETPPDFCLSSKPQLMAIETSFQQGADFHGCGINIGLSSDICTLLALNYENGAIIAECEEIAFNVYLQLSTKTKNGRDSQRKRYRSYGPSFNSINISVRNGGTPHFIVPGNCACLGANPDEFKHDHEMYSHNLDTALQQMTMLTSLISFWNNILKPLSKKM
jgi:hypothetical protein